MYRIAFTVTGENSSLECLTTKTGSSIVNTVHVSIITVADYFISFSV
jgi:hypothetical protein